MGAASGHSRSGRPGDLRHLPRRADAGSRHESRVLLPRCALPHGDWRAAGQRRRRRGARLCATKTKEKKQKKGLQKKTKTNKKTKLKKPTRKTKQTKKPNTKRKPRMRPKD